MVWKSLVISAFLGMSTMTPTFAAEGRVAAKQGSPSGRTSAAAVPTSPLGAPKSPVLPLTEPYTILNTMSIFAVDHRSADGRFTGPTRAEQAGTMKPAVRQVPVFRGVMIDDNGPLALMEIPDATGGMSNEYLREGQTVSWGDSKVLSITFDKLRLSRTPAYAWQNSWIDVSIGFDLNGRQIGTLPLLPGTGRWNLPNRGDPRRGWMSELGVPRNFGSNGLVGIGLDPDLPAGSADNLEARMIQRRENQLREVLKPTEASMATITYE